MTSSLSSLALPGFIFEKPALSILLPMLLGTAVGYSTRPKETQDTYLALKQPPLRPPGYVFGPVWTALYGSMGYAAYRAWTTGMASLSPSDHEWTEQAAGLYTIQLGLNLIWMPLFFKYHRPIAATVDIFTLTGVTTYMAWMWSQIDEVAGWAIAPYIAWLGFATYLCAGVGYLNDWDIQSKARPAPAQGSSNRQFVNERVD